MIFLHLENDLQKQIINRNYPMLAFPPNEPSRILEVGRNKRLSIRIGLSAEYLDIDREALHTSHLLVACSTRIQDRKREYGRGDIPRS